MRTELASDACEAIRSLVKKIVLTPIDGELTIEVHGTLAGILHLGTNGTASSLPNRWVDLALVDKPIDRQRVARLDLDFIQIGRLDDDVLVLLVRVPHRSPERAQSGRTSSTSSAWFA